MKMHWSPKSPFVRKAMIAAHELGLTERIELVRTVTTMRVPNPALLPDNPLSKIPTLLLDDGSPLYDSLTICEYFDHLAGGGILFPPAGPERWQALLWHSLANGLLDIVILWRNEREKDPSIQYDEWIAAFATKTRISLDRLEDFAPEMDAARFGIGHIAVGSCLSYLDFRFDTLAWRDGRPALARWYDGFRLRPSAAATEIVND
jgi:glutathione S-transferase